MAIHDDDYPSSDDQSFKSFTEDDHDQRKPDNPTQQQKPSAQNHDRLADSPPPPADEPVPARAEVERFPPEEEKQLLSQSNEEKASANQLFGKGSFENAIQSYDRALSSCPNYLDYEIAVLRSNISACHIKLSEWKEAVEAATKGLDCLERLEPLPVVRDKKAARTGKPGEDGKAEDDVVEEVDENLEERMENLRLSGHTIAEVRKLQIKMLLRRAKGKTEQGGWASLQGAEEDYKILLSPTMAPSLSPADKRSVMENARALAPKLNEAKDKEMAEMMGKLKGLGNSILKPFGLSTENFQFQQDPKTGGYSMNFNQSPGGN